jgi:hypothetical protein
VLNWPNKLTQKLLDEKLLSLFHPSHFEVIEEPQNGTFGIFGLRLYKNVLYRRLEILENNICLDFSYTTLVTSHFRNILRIYAKIDKTVQLAQNILEACDRSTFSPKGNDIK